MRRANVLRNALDANANTACKPDADVTRTGSRGRILAISTREDLTMLEEVGRVLGIYAPEPNVLESSRAGSR